MKPFFQSERGSVMMEFIIVFPIYLVLFASVMAIGDMLVHSIRLPSAERIAVFDIGEWQQDQYWNRVLDTLFHPNDEFADQADASGSRKQDDLSRAGDLHHVADLSVEGPWSVLAGITVRDDYLLPVGGTAGQLAFCDWYFADVTDGKQAGGDFGNLISGTARMEMRSKVAGAANRTYAYNYYTLKRKRYQVGAGVGLTWRDHNRSPGDLLVASGLDAGNRRWEDCVKNEKWHKYEEISEAEDNTEQPPSKETGAAKYTRYSKFIPWSK